MEFQRIKRLPPYVFSIIDGMKMEARHRGEDIVDFGMGNPDLPTPPHVVAKLIEAAGKPQNHRYSVSRGIYKLRLAIVAWYKRRYNVDLDPDSEAIIRQNLSQIARGRTVIIVSHRLSTLVDADAILVVDRGKIADIGRHDQLVSRCVTYRHLWNQQTRQSA